MFRINTCHLFTRLDIDNDHVCGIELKDINWNRTTPASSNGVQYF